MPIYNVSKYIKESLTSALNQNYQNIEYILVDDKSNDESLDIVTQLLKNNYRSSYVTIHSHEQNMGLSAARNTGLKLSKGEYVFFLDSDDIITPDCIQTHLNAVIRSGADFSTGALTVIGGRTKIHNKKIGFDYKEDDEILLSFLKREWGVSACNKLIKRDILINNNLFFVYGLIHEDILWSFELAKCSKKMVNIPENTYNYMIHPNSIIKKKNVEKKVDSICFILNKFIDSDNKLTINKSVKISLGQYLTFLRLTFSCIIINSDESLKIQEKLFNRINSEKFKKNSCGFISYFLKLPYSVFFTIFYFPYYLYKKC